MYSKYIEVINDYNDNIELFYNNKINELSNNLNE